MTPSLRDDLAGPDAIKDEHGVPCVPGDVREDYHIIGTSTVNGEPAYFIALAGTDLEAAIAAVPVHREAHPEFDTWEVARRVTLSRVYLAAEIHAARDDHGVAVDAGGMVGPS